MTGKRSTTKKAVNVTLDADLVAEAKEFGTNLSQVLERAVREAHREQRWAKWRKDNREATESMNAYVKKHGLWSKKYRVW